jgi:glycosyltransferase involved in cell wall biosynthesis
METRIVCLSADPGAPFGAARGASVRVAELVDALAREGARVLALVSGVARGAARPAAGATVEPPPGPSSSDWLAAEGERTDWIEGRLERFEAQALYERLAERSAAGSRAAARLGIPHFVEIDAPVKAGPRRRRGLQAPDGAEQLEREVLARAERVLAVSSPLARHALRRGAGRVEVFGGAAELDRHRCRPRRRRARAVAVFTGRVRRRHGVETVAAAWRLMGDAAPVLVVAGDAGEASGLLEETGAVLLGPIPHCQVHAVLAEADIGLAPHARDAPDWFSPAQGVRVHGCGTRGGGGRASRHARARLGRARPAGALRGPGGARGRGGGAGGGRAAEGTDEQQREGARGGRAHPASPGAHVIEHVAGRAVARREAVLA